MRKTKAILLNILLITVSLAFTLGVIEIGFRYFTNKQKPVAEDRPAVYFSHETAATLQDNSPAPKAPGSIRIVVIGDSFTFAPYMQADDTFPRRLERWLNLNAEQPKVEVLNFGFPAYSTSHEVNLVKKAMRNGADLVILQITLNDTEIKPYTPKEISRKNKFGVPTYSGGIYDYWKSLAYAASRIANSKTHREYKQYFFDLFEKGPALAKFRKSIKEMKLFSEKKKTPIAAVTFPLFGMGVDDQYPFTEQHQKISHILEKKGIPNLDLLSAYLNMSANRLVVLPGKDFHPNEIAHRIAAEQIYLWLEKEKLLPEEVFAKHRFNERVKAAKPASPLITPKS